MRFLSSAILFVVLMSCVYADEEKDLPVSGRQSVIVDALNRVINNVKESNRDRDVYRPVRPIISGIIGDRDRDRDVYRPGHGDRDGYRPGYDRRPDYDRYRPGYDRRPGTNRPVNVIIGNPEGRP